MFAMADPCIREFTQQCKEGSLTVVRITEHREKTALSASQRLSPDGPPNYEDTMFSGIRVTLTGDSGTYSNLVEDANLAKLCDGGISFEPEMLIEVLSVTEPNAKMSTLDEGVVVCTVSWRIAITARRSGTVTFTLQKKSLSALASENDTKLADIQKNMIKTILEAQICLETRMTRIETEQGNQTSRTEGARSRVVELINGFEAKLCSQSALLDALNTDLRTQKARADATDIRIVQLEAQLRNRSSRIIVLESRLTAVEEEASLLSSHFETSTSPTIKPAPATKPVVTIKSTNTSRPGAQTIIPRIK